MAHDENNLDVEEYDRRLRDEKAILQNMDPVALAKAREKVGPKASFDLVWKAYVGIVGRPAAVATLMITAIRCPNK